MDKLGEKKVSNIELIGDKRYRQRLYNLMSGLAFENIDFLINDSSNQEMYDLGRCILTVVNAQKERVLQLENDINMIVAMSESKEKFSVKSDRGSSNE